MQIEIPNIIADEADAALKSAAWSIAHAVAAADHSAPVGGPEKPFDGIFVVDPEWRATQVAKIDALMNVAATLASIEPRNWAEAMVADSRTTIEAAHDRMTQAGAARAAVQGTDGHEAACMAAEAAATAYFATLKGV